MDRDSWDFNMPIIENGEFPTDYSIVSILECRVDESWGAREAGEEGSLTLREMF